MSEKGSSQPRRWYVLADEQRYGPYPERELLVWLKKSAFAPEARFSCGGGWVTASQALQLIHSADNEPVLLEVAAAEPQSAPTPNVDPAAAPEAPSGGPAVAPASLAGALEAEAPPTEPMDAVPRRDRIVVIGRRASGKTIYLATLYRQLWKSRDGLTMKALTGQVHRELISISETLRRSEWPAATLKTTLAHMEMEVTYKGHTRILVGLDYAGEVFRDAFVNDDSESPETKALISHIDRAAAVILLIDPSVAVSGDAEAFVDDDFGIVQAIRRIRDWPGGEKVPVALVMTKADQNLHLLKGKESAREFIASHYPALVRTLGRSRFFHASAVQAKRSKEGRLRPCPDSVPVNIAQPLKYCLEVLSQQEEQERILAEQEAKQQAVQEYVLAQEEAQKRTQRNVALFAIGLVTLGICIVALIIILNM